RREKQLGFDLVVVEGFEFSDLDPRVMPEDFLWVLANPVAPQNDGGLGATLGTLRLDLIQTGISRLERRGGGESERKGKQKLSHNSNAHRRGLRPTVLCGPVRH